MSLHSGIIVGRYQESGQDRSFLAAAWEREIKVGVDNDFRMLLGLRKIFV